MKLRWSFHAIQDRDAIFGYIEQRDPAAAIKVDERIGRQIGTLTQFPNSGRPGRVDGTRGLVVAHTPYIAAYVVLDDAVMILRVLHGSQRWPDGIQKIRPGIEARVARHRLARWTMPTAQPIRVS